jgi:hypothetical protein
MMDETRIGVVVELTKEQDIIERSIVRSSRRAVAGVVMSVR